jgi:hypothetical protein
MTTPGRKGFTRSASISDARAYLVKSQEFLRASIDSLNLDNRIAATGNAVHAGICATDAIAAARGGTVWKGEHSQAAIHLERAAGIEGRQAARHLRRLLPLKNKAEYEPQPVSPNEAAAVETARRVVAIAEQVLQSLKN